MDAITSISNVTGLYPMLTASLISILLPKFMNINKYSYEEKQHRINNLSMIIISGEFYDTVDETVIAMD